ncbi:hypothetical protein A3I42_04015 [Candidatus Uhrbacteria bacterium RIFCSPLOWO2_02_FULL_49_11]|uniref:SpoVT-AbrB domain-containing protein n=1 Tax=Candidatus Uhrbacteria bacterium RIFCSPLOWO2_02_FULL_49_11 TaxID=1802409 RepID=A0A1F7VFQ2_9BACT|nr:MAG: hypothetical protein A3I42_04015 [Candidatus Uhrbacteria bacterium RIFCSPLOWO2_02_FULL_49_11]
MGIATLSQKYQIVVPREVRDRLRLKAGAKIMIHPLDDTRAVLTKHPTDYVQALQGLGKEVWQSLGGTDTYILQERSSWDK